VTVWIAETLSRPPLRVGDDTSAEALQSELSERLEALLASHNGLEPTAEGWRALALELALRHEPAFQIETPVDRASIGGRPVGLGDFILRSMLKAEVRKGNSQSQASKIVARRVDQKARTLNNLFSRKATTSDSMRREKYELTAKKALQKAAAFISQK
jgi:hypothetical protein